LFVGEPGCGKTLFPILRGRLLKFETKIKIKIKVKVSNP